jgi:hypothetical protein
MHAEMQRELAEAEASGDAKTADELRKLLKRTQKLIDDYGLSKREPSA